MFGFALLLTLSHSPHLGQPPGKREFNALYVRMNSRFVHRDVKGLASFMREDFQYVGTNGHGLRRAEFLQSAMLFLKQVKSPKDVETVDSVALKGSTATLNVHEVFAGTLQLEDHRKHALKQTDTATDTWEKTGGVWLLKKTVVHTTSRFMDGKPQSHQNANARAA